MTETLTRYVLELIFDEWPTPMIPSDLLRIDKNESVVLDTGAVAQGVDLAENIVVSVGRDSTDHTPEGTLPRYETLETLDVEIEAADSREFGTVSSHADFRRVVNNVQRALDAERSFPDVSLTNRDRQPTRLEMFVEEESDRSSNHRNHYSVGFPLRIRGKLDPDK
jgi:hypothetical protein